MKKIALPVANSQLSQHFGHPEYFYIYEADEKTIKNEEMLVPPPHTPGAYPKWMADMGVTDVIVGGIGQKAIDLFNSNGINVFVGAEIKNPKDLVNELLQGTLRSRENLCNHDGDHDHQHGHHQH